MAALRLEDHLFVSAGGKIKLAGGLPSAASSRIPISRLSLRSDEGRAVVLSQSIMHFPARQRISFPALSTEKPSSQPRSRRSEA